jgi:hypothetical protein
MRAVRPARGAARPPKRQSRRIRPIEIDVEHAMDA